MDLDLDRHRILITQSEFENILTDIKVRELQLEVLARRLRLYRDLVIKIGENLAIDHLFE